METINVELSHYKNNKGYKKVKAMLVGGKEGVFAAWQEGHLIHMATGDDGHWRELTSFDKAWITKIIRVLDNFRE